MKNAIGDAVGDLLPTLVIFGVHLWFVLERKALEAAISALLVCATYLVTGEYAASFWWIAIYLVWLTALIRRADG